MKKFTLVSSALLIASSLSAVSPALESLHGTVTGKIQPTKVSDPKLRRALANPDIKSFKLANNDVRKDLKANRAKSKKVPDAPITESILETPPAGELTNWSRDALSWTVFWGSLYQDYVAGYVQRMVQPENSNEVYMNLQVTGFPLNNSWIKGVKNEDGSLSFPSGQLVYQEEDEEGVYPFAMVGLSYFIDEEGYVNYGYLDSMDLVYNNGVYQTKDDSVVFGLCLYDPEEESGWYWTGFGDSEISISPVTESPLQLPAGLTADKWSCINDLGGYMVNVAVDADKVYVGGLDPECPDAYIVGNLQQDGTSVVFEGGQFLGASENSTWSYLYGGDVNELWDDYWEEYYYEVNLTGSLNFQYDARGNRLVATNSPVFAANRSENLEDVVPVSYLSNVTIVKQERNPEAAPAPPTDVFVEDYYENYGDIDLYFTILPFDTEGTLLDTANLYYRIYLDDEVFTFYSDEYYGIPEDEMELMPVSFYNNMTIFKSGNSYCVYFLMEGMETFGIQTVYLQPAENGEPVELASEIVTVSLNNVAVKNISDKNVASSAYFDLQGRRIANPSDHGLYIVRNVMNDGSVKTSKVVK